MDSGLCFFLGKVWILACVSCMGKYGSSACVFFGVSKPVFPVCESDDSWILPVFLLISESMDSGLCFFYVKVEILVCVSCVGK
jgi:hypothetical protein